MPVTEVKIKRKYIKMLHFYYNVKNMNTVITNLHSCKKDIFKVISFL